MSDSDSQIAAANTLERISGPAGMATVRRGDHGAIRDVSMWLIGNLPEIPAEPIRLAALQRLWLGRIISMDRVRQYLKELQLSLALEGHKTAIFVMAVQDQDTPDSARRITRQIFGGLARPDVEVLLNLSRGNLDPQFRFATPDGEFLDGQEYVFMRWHRSKERCTPHTQRLARRRRQASDTNPRTHLDRRNTLAMKPRTLE